MAFSEALKDKVRKLADMCCCICRQRVPTDVHHITPQEEDGPDVDANAVPLCPTCHRIFGGNKDLRKWLRSCRDHWYERVANGNANSEASPETLFYSYSLQGMLLYDRQRVTTKAWFHKWIEDITDWFERLVVAIRDTYGLDSAIKFKQMREKHSFKQDNGHPYGYEQWKEVVRDDLQALALTIANSTLSEVTERSTAHTFVEKIESMMPELLVEMKQDLNEHPLRREFILLERIATYHGGADILMYYFDDHDELKNKMRILENLDLVMEITYNNTDRYVMSEEFVDYLLDKEKDK